MNEINNLIYVLEINFENNAGIDSSISVKFCDNGLKVKSVSVGNDQVTEETINGRVLSGRFDSLEGYCGYRYDYQNGETLLNINPDVSINDAVFLINKIKRGAEFLTAELVLSSILRNDYRVLTLNKGKLSITKIVSAENEKAEECSVQEIIDLLKKDGEESFAVQGKRSVYQIADKCVVEENQTAVKSDIKNQLKELIDILNQHPQNLKEMVEMKNRLQSKNASDASGEEKSL